MNKLPSKRKLKFMEKYYTKFNQITTEFDNTKNKSINFIPFAKHSLPFPNVIKNIIGNIKSNFEPFHFTVSLICYSLITYGFISMDFSIWVYLPIISLLSIATISSGFYAFYRMFKPSKLDKYNYYNDSIFSNILEWSAFKYAKYEYDKIDYISISKVINNPNKSLDEVHYLTDLEKDYPMLYKTALVGSMYKGNTYSEIYSIQKKLRPLYGRENKYNLYDTISSNLNSLKMFDFIKYPNSTNKSILKDVLDDLEIDDNYDPLARFTTLNRNSDEHDNMEVHKSTSYWNMLVYTLNIPNKDDLELQDVNLNFQLIFGVLKIVNIVPVDDVFNKFKDGFSNLDYILQSMVDSFKETGEIPILDDSLIIEIDRFLKMFVEDINLINDLKTTSDKQKTDVTLTSNKTDFKPIEDLFKKQNDSMELTNNMYHTEIKETLKMLNKV